MNNRFSGNYPIENRAGEIERLDLQSQAMAPDTMAMLDRIGPMRDWIVLDLGCGPGGITDLLSERVLPNGKVIGIDKGLDFIEHARKHAAFNVEFRRDDAYGSELSPGSFDLVHLRFVASTAGNVEHLLNEAVRLAKPGGVVALQEPDASTLNCYPHHPAWDLLRGTLLNAFESVDADLQFLVDCTI